MASQISWDRERHLRKEESVWLYPRIINIRFSIVEFFVEQIRHPNGHESVPVGQAVIDGRIHEPESVTARVIR